MNSKQLTWDISLQSPVWASLIEQLEIEQFPNSVTKSSHKEIIFQKRKKREGMLFQNSEEKLILFLKKD